MYDAKAVAARRCDYSGAERVWGKVHYTLESVRTLQELTSFAVMGHLQI